MAQAQTVEVPAAPAGWRRALALAAVLGGAFIATLDLRATAQGRISISPLQMEAWGAVVPTEVWVALALHGTLVLACLPLWGKLSDVHGRRRVWLVGLLLFMAGSAGIPILGEPSDVPRLLANFVQALGAGALVVAGRALIGDMYPRSERAKWHGALAAAIGLGIFGEPTLRQLLWQLFISPGSLSLADFNAVLNTAIPWPLYVNLPFGGFLILAGWFGFPPQRASEPPRVDVRGAAALVGATVLLLMPFKLASSRFDGAYVWLSAPTIALLAGGVLMFVASVVLARRAPDPVINLRALTNRTYGAAVLLGCVAAIALANVGNFAWYFNQIGVVDIRGDFYSLRFPEQVASGLAFAVGAVVAGQVMWRTGRCKRPTLALLLIGMVGALLMARLSSETTMVDLVLATSVIGLGLGGLTAVLITVVQNAMPARSLGEVTAGLAFFGGVSAALAAPFFDWLVRATHADVLTRPPPDGRYAKYPVLAQLDALTWVFVITVALMAAGVLIALWMPETPVGRTAAASPRPAGVGRLGDDPRRTETRSPPSRTPTDSAGDDTRDA